MATNTTTVLERQKAYVKGLKESNFKFPLTVGSAFVRGMRDIGYKHTGTALDELIDNSYEGGATNIHVILNEDGATRKGNVSEIAIIDDGVGMIPEMIRVAMLWGGTDRENSRGGIGRFGYGLPSSCVSQGRRFEVYSKPEGLALFAGVVDLDDIERGEYTGDDGDIVVPPAKPAKLPRFVQAYVEKNLPKGAFDKGTVVVISKLDKLTWKSANALQNQLMEHFGVVYHNLRSNFDLHVNAKRVEPIDPLFLTPGYRWFDVDGDRAKALDPIKIDVKDKDTRQILGSIRVRFSYMSPRFASINKKKDATGSNANERFSILKEYNGFIVCRMGRVIEVVRHSPLGTFVNNDRYIKVELDFDAALDEFFNVPTSKQRVDVSDRIWDILKDQGLETAITQLRGKFKEEKQSAGVQSENEPDTKRPSELAMEEAAKMGAVVPPPIAEKRAEAAQRRLVQEIEKRVHETGKDPTEVQRDIEVELGDRPFKVAQRSVPGGAFFDVEQIGGTKVLWLNTSTRFFQEVYAGPASSPAVRAALEVLLFAIGDRKMEGLEQVQAFYVYEIPQWSSKLELALMHLSQNIATPTEAEADTVA